MPSERRFIDSNVILYLAGADAGKAAIAEKVLAGGGVISVQVLNEVANVLTRKARLSMTETGNFTATISKLVDVRPLDLDTHCLGMALCDDHNFSIYDGMIVAAAILADCDMLISEDMQHAMTIGPVTISNPFIAR